MAFALDYRTMEMSDVKIIASRSCFPQGEQKNERSYDVVFTSGIERLRNGRALLYAGLSDCAIGKILIADPLDEYEAL
ncbi:hypothetical protein SDC9_212549 [bioreactor metagenome]|uniref:Uncharacterized protein n=1 Tax=bioreactor metagenome TaxID=1076179 RepID=A0A645JNB5_9ZZZZ